MKMSRCSFLIPLTLIACWPGSGFGAVPGSGQVWLGTLAGVVQSWSDARVVATVAPGSTSGNAQVLQNGVMSNAVPFSVNTPHITDVSPPLGVPGTSVTITGTGFGSPQGSGGNVLLGSTSGQVLSWSDTQVVALVASTSLTGIAQIQQNGVASNAVGFTVPVPGGNIVLPAVLNMVVGDTHTVQALGPTGQPAKGLTWTSSDPTVVSLSTPTDDPPILTALAAGHVKITGGTATVDVTVSAGALGLGTVLWSNPGNGSGVAKIVPAVPSPSGVADVFAFQGDGTVQAITSDGLTAWTAYVGDALRWEQAGQAVPDFQGGLVVMDRNANSIVKLDGITGQPYPVYIVDGASFLGKIAVHTDGTIFAVQSNPGDNASIVGIDPTTGKQKFSVPIPHTGVEPFLFTDIKDIMIAADGYAYLPYGYAYSTGGSPGNWPSHIAMLRINSSGASDNFNILDYRGSLGDWLSIQARAITNVDTGVLLSFNYPSGPEGKSGMAITTGASFSLVSAPQVPGQAGAVDPVLQAQDGSFVGTAWTGYYGDVPNLVAFDANGNVRWSVPGYGPKIASADGSVIGQAYDPDTYDFTGPAVTFDQNGSATGQLGNLPTYSWKGAYQLGSTDAVVPDFDPAEIAETYAAVPEGNLAGNGFSLVHHTFGLVFCGPNTGDDGGCSSTPDVTFSYYPGINDSNYASAVDFSGLYPQWVRTVKDQALESFKAAFANLPAIVARGETASKLHHDQNPQNLDSFEHTVYIDGHWMLSSESPRSGLVGLDATYPPNGYTTPANRNTTDAKIKWSRAYYLPIMGNAQAALGCVGGGQCAAAVSPAYAKGNQDPDKTEFSQLMTAIGRGIGNVAAHETAHQLVPFDLMDCVNSCESQDVYEAAGSTANYPWFYSENAFYKLPFSDTPIKARLHWGSKVAAAIVDYLLPKKK